MNQAQLEQIIKEVMVSLGNSDTTTETAPAAGAEKNKVEASKDYPLSSKRPELLRTPTGKGLDDITLQSVLNGDIQAQDVRIAPETLELQAQVAESVGRDPFAANLRRAAELIAVPDERILEIYNALRPNRSTKAELHAIADELETKYNAKINAELVREAADVYEQRDVLKSES